MSEETFKDPRVRWSLYNPVYICTIKRTHAACTAATSPARRGTPPWLRCAAPPSPPVAARALDGGANAHTRHSRAGRYLQPAFKLCAVPHDGAVLARAKDNVYTFVPSHGAQ